MFHMNTCSKHICPFPNIPLCLFQHDETALSVDCQEMYCDDGDIQVGSTLCVEHAECTQMTTEPYYQCTCEQGYEGDGQELCELDACEYTQYRIEMGLHCGRAKNISVI